MSLTNLSYIYHAILQYFTIILRIFNLYFVEELQNFYPFVFN